ncbi:MAG: biotin/lipoyl-binding carrier protein [Acidimicrobiales bacterium]
MVEIRAEIAATVWKVEVEAGQLVDENHELIILESMKMEIPVVATSAGTVAEVHVGPEDRVNEGDLLVTLNV